MDPISIGMIAVQGLSVLAQLYNSEKARGESKKRLQEIARIFDEIKPPGYDVSVMDPPEYIQQAIPEPTFDPAGLSPESYKWLTNFAPEIAPYVQQARPELAQATAAGTEGQDAQLEALRGLRQAASGDDPTYQARLNQLARKAQEEAGSRTASIEQGAESRGALTSGLTSALKAQEGSAAMDRFANMGVDAASDSYGQALAAMRDSASLGGDIRGQDFNEQSFNANTINRFNEMTSRNYQDYLNNRANTANAAQKFNIEGQQGAADANVAANNDAQKFNIGRDDSNQKYLHGVRSDERDYQNRMREATANWQRGERNRTDDLQQRMFNNSLSMGSAKAGNIDSAMEMARQDTRDRNAFIGSMGDTASEGMKWNRDDQQHAENRDDARDIAYFDYYGRPPTEEERKRFGGSWKN